MTDQRTAPPPSSTEASTGTQESLESSPDQAQQSRGGWLAFAAVAWLVAVLTILRRGFAPDATSDIALATAASALLTLTLSGILAGAAVGIWAGSQLAARRPSLRPRQLVAALAGLATGVLASVAVLLVRGMPSGAIWVLAIVLGLAGGLGGALSTLRPQGVAYAGTIATLVNLVFFNVVQLNSTWLLNVFGADGTSAGNQAANGYLSLLQALVAGLLGGLVAYRVLRREAPVGAKWTLYLLAGGIPGLLWIVGDLITRIGTARLLTLASTDSAGEKLIQHSLGGSRVLTGMILFFVGGLTAMIAFGRTLPKAKA